MCMYIIVSPLFFLMKNWPKVQQRSALEFCACLGRFKKSVILDISVFFLFFFSHGPVGKDFSNEQTAFLI